MKKIFLFFLILVYSIDNLAQQNETIISTSLNKKKNVKQKVVTQFRQLIKTHDIHWQHLHTIEEMLWRGNIAPDLNTTTNEMKEAWLKVYQADPFGECRSINRYTYNRDKFFNLDSIQNPSAATIFLFREIEFIDLNCRVLEKDFDNIAIHKLSAFPDINEKNFMKGQRIIDEIYLRTQSFPGYDIIGVELTYKILDIFMFSEWDYINKYFELIKEKEGNRKFPPYAVAKITDRKLFLEGKPSLYGMAPEKDYPVQDPKNLPMRRVQMSLLPYGNNGNIVESIIEIYNKYAK